MTSSELHRIGRLVYGEQWQSQFARRIGMSRRQIGRYVAGEAKVPELVKLAFAFLLDHPDQRFVSRPSKSGNAQF